MSSEKAVTGGGSGGGGLVQQCLDILQREDIKKQCKKLLTPLLDFLLYEIKPYLYLTFSLILLIFMMLLIILVLLVFLLRNKPWVMHLTSASAAASSE